LGWHQISKNLVILYFRSTENHMTVFGSIPIGKARRELLFGPRGHLEPMAAIAIAPWPALSDGLNDAAIITPLPPLLSRGIIQIAWKKQRSR
jgi:hypothetical protein